ncbi:uncharacterized protein BCR38DRAFT_436008 [Pseudomassariella vexata]|uniref:Uncharacterized protein n=1 Tax=Pseudomassariella vexata TaxID=1141098 RepID=A0A1Y2DV25_9PEZI|nr:uncharacterized protein BCR38DRAFT_436008 [Pseudomassariella vexata]ORY63140.1 hypothetical protein BCR38DRAFT_436008 [Pseudomassariella vexata]
MAQAMAIQPNRPGLQATALTADELREIQEYDKIVRFRDRILSGSHPRIKAPTQSLGNGQSRPQFSSQPATETISSSTRQILTKSYQIDNLESFRANSHQSAVAATAALGSSITGVGTSRSFGSGTTEIDPLLLTKSDELIKAELQLQRQKLERTLREQLDQSRAASKAAQQASEEVSDFNHSDVLAKALTLVQATAPPAPADANPPANQSDASDSFDENTFYSSQHDTPEPHISPRAHNAPESIQIPDSLPSLPRPNPSEHVQSLPNAGFAPGRNEVGTSRQVYNSGGRPRVQAPVPEVVNAQVISSNESGTTSRSNSGNVDSEQRLNQPRVQQPHQLLAGPQLSHPGSPLIRAHNLSPLAPQPAHVSRLATVRQPPVLDPEISILPGAPAQVAALRQQEAGNGTSPESSPQGEKGNKKKNKKKNKRKAAELRAQEPPVSPYIKPEPRSPSPLSCPQFTRPNKRQRQSHRPQQELNYDEPREPVEIGRQEEYVPRPHREERLPMGYERIDDPYARPIRQSVAPSSHRLGLPVYEDCRPDETVKYVRRVASPSGYPTQYVPGEIRSMRSATYSSAAEPLYQDGPVYRRDGRMSVRPVADRARSRSPVLTEAWPSAMAPPRALPPRIVRDQFGREYLEPSPSPPVARHSVAPVGRPEPEIVYERAPARPASRLLGPDNTYEHDGVIYRRASPTFAPRRIVTQPEYGAVDYRGYRQRDYSAQPIPAPGGEYIQYGGVTERRIIEEMPREYSRAASIRPAEPIRYEYGRMQSVRPDMPPREYAASVHPESRRELPPHVIPEYGFRPAETGIPRREYSARPVERYCDRPAMPEEEVAFIERPRTVQQEIVYEDGRRIVPVGPCVK